MSNTDKNPTTKDGDIKVPNTDKNPTKKDGDNKVPNTDKSPLLISEADKGENKPVQNLTTITEVSNTEVRTEVRIEVKNESSPYCKRNSNRHRPSCDTPMQTDK